jgi:hypothetical protein
MINAKEAYTKSVENNERLKSDMEVIEKKIAEACNSGLFYVNVNGLKTDNFDVYIAKMSSLGYRCHYIRGDSALSIEWPTPKENA